MTVVEKELQAARQRLLDLTMRNRLLNFRPTKVRTVSVIDEIPREIYDILVLKERVMEFLPKAKPPEDLETGGGIQQTLLEEMKADATVDFTDEEISLLWRLPAPGAEVATRHVDRFLQTPLESEVLQKRLFYISQESHSILEELGYSTLYLAMGFLEWMESPDSEQPKRAPLILVPVELERTKVSSSFKLQWNGDDISTNVSLQAILYDQGVSLPDFEMPDDKVGVDQYLQRVDEAISTKPKWRVVTDIYLGFFSFTKFIMHKDLDWDAWPEGKSPADHPLIKAILDPSETTVSDQGFKEEEVDQRLTSRDLYHVMDADPSQIAVIEDVKAGQNLVVEGPPGTGKSQTIANIIAELLAAGRKVLFVSEKMAALEVVKNRLDDVGLGDFCLELHSRKSNKRQVLKELERTISTLPPKYTSLEEDFDQLEALKSELNGYTEALGKSFGKLNLSPYALLCQIEKSRRHFAERERVMPSVSFSKPDQCDKRQYDAAKWKLNELREALPLVSPIATHSWKGCRPGTVLPSDEQEIGNLIDQCKKAVEHLEESIDRVVSACAIKSLPLTLKDLAYVRDAARVMAESQQVEPHVLLNPEWNTISEKAESLILRTERFGSQLADLLSKFLASALDGDIQSTLNEYEALSTKFFALRFLDSRHRHLKQSIRGLYKIQPPTDSQTILSDLRQLAEWQRLQKEIREEERSGTMLFGSYWHSEESDPQILRQLAEWIPSFRKLLLEGVVADNAVDIVSAGVSREQVERAVVQMAEAKRSFVEKRDRLSEMIGADYRAIVGTNADDMPFPQMAFRLILWQSGLPGLQWWAQFVALHDDCLSTVARPMVSLIDEDMLEPEDVVPCFEGNFADDLLRLAFAERPSLATFVGSLHEGKIGRFADLDRRLITKNRQRLTHKLYQNRPRISGGASAGSEAGILQGEFSRKRKHKPIRQLMSLAGGLIQSIKPCFMMSPLSIAQFLDPTTVCFDVVIFDEASQVKPEDALGAFLRGNQIVVMGDTRQLPPTSFFDHIMESDDSEELDMAATVADVESILHQCKRYFPTKTLRWHYRSKHESLVAVSNQEFYDNQLLLYPSPFDKAEHLGLQFVQLSGATYDRGRSSVNREEARAVAEAALEHYRKFPHKSLGIGTFNIKQQQAILEQIELQIRCHPEMEEFFSASRKEHFFVKNLETIQGDERDVIFLSVGFGFDEFGRLSRNFGPINQEGGERRLNVLLTRARERCVLFSNFRAGDLSLDSTSSFGLRVLKVFLDYAETRNLRSIDEGREDTDSPFEDSIYDFLRSAGYEVRKQVGCAGFWVDLAVVDPEFPGRYLLGIECDGAKYHTSPVARDRDRLRQQVLERLGWRIHRIWSTDWYRNRNQTQQTLLESIRQASCQKPDPIDLQPTETMLVSDDRLASDFRADLDSGLPTGNTTLYDSIPEYEVCSSPDWFRAIGELHEYPVRNLARLVTHIVDVECPVHFDEVVHRIRSFWGLRRAGQRIRDAVMKATLVAEREGQIHRRSDFLWPAEDRTICVRRRLDDPPPKLDLICDEEIAEAIKLVLKSQFATKPDDLTIQSSRLFGVQATHANVTDRISKVTQKLVDEGILERMLNGMIGLAQS